MLMLSKASDSCLRAIKESSTNKIFSAFRRSLFDISHIGICAFSCRVDLVKAEAPRRAFARYDLKASNTSHKHIATDTRGAIQCSSSHTQWSYQLNEPRMRRRSQAISHDEHAILVLRGCDRAKTNRSRHINDRNRKVADGHCPNHMVMRVGIWGHWLERDDFWL